MALPPTPRNPEFMSHEWQEWFRKVRFEAGGTPTTLFTDLDFTGSNITSILTRNHNDLTSVQGGVVGERFHLTDSQHTDLTDGGDSNLHFHSSDRDRTNHTGTQDHNTTLSGMQGGSASERFHLTQAQHDTIADLDSGTYGPTLTSVANLDSTTSFSAQFLRVGDVVTVSGQIEVDPTTVDTQTQVRISLPIPSNFSSDNHCAGCGAMTNIQQSVSILADTSNDEALMSWFATDTTNQTVLFTFTYRVI